jgi:hypothetical protein
MKRDTIDIEKERAEFRKAAEGLVARAKPGKRKKVRCDLERILDAALRRAQFTCVQGRKKRKMEKGPYE